MPRQLEKVMANILKGLRGIGGGLYSARKEILRLSLWLTLGSTALDLRWKKKRYLDLEEDYQILLQKKAEKPKPLPNSTGELGIY
jgi:hypothetical protein